MKKIIYLFLLLATFVDAKFLMPNEAFQPSVTLKNNSINVEIKLGKDIHIYKDTLKVQTANKNIYFDTINYPKSIMSDGKEIYEHSVNFTINLHKTKTAKRMENLELVLEYQGCSSKGLCYEPAEEKYSFKVDTSLLSLKGVKTKETSLNETDKITDSFKNDSMIMVLLTFFGFGLLLSMTPCIFPMIPILSSIIVSQGEGMSAKRGFFLSLVYVLSMAIAYTLAGVLAGIFGSNLQAAMQNPYVVVSFAVVFVALAFSMFGFYEIGLPSSLQSKLSKASDNASDKGGILGVAIMGFLSALIVGPCVAPPLAGTLVYIGQTGDAFLGGLALFVMSLGMGVPLLLIGLGAGKFMPKPGGWMSIVSKVFGVVMLAIAIWMLQKILSSEIIMGLWATLFLISSIYLGALETLGEKRGFNALRKGIGIILFIYALSLFIGLFSGSTSMMKPFEKFTKTSTTYAKVEQQNELHFQKVTSVEELDKLLRINKGKKILLDFSAKWCTSCKEYEEITFKDKDVINKLKTYVLIRADVTKNGDDEKALSNKYNIFGPPAILIFDKNTKLIESKKIIGYKEPKEFLSLIE